MSLTNLLSSKAKVAVSATAPGTSRKAVLTDSEEPWTGPSLPSFLHLTFAPISGATHIAITFQGGFVGTKTEVWTAGTNSESAEIGLHQAGNIYPEDKSKRQVFQLPFSTSTESTISSLTELKLVFGESSDNQGRITVYQVEILG